MWLVQTSAVPRITCETVFVRHSYHYCCYHISQLVGLLWLVKYEGRFALYGPLQKKCSVARLQLVAFLVRPIYFKDITNILLNPFSRSLLEVTGPRYFHVNVWLQARFTRAVNQSVDGPRKRGWYWGISCYLQQGLSSLKTGNTWALWAPFIWMRTMLLWCLRAKCNFTWYVHSTGANLTSFW